MEGGQVDSGASWGKLGVAPVCSMSFVSSPPAKGGDPFGLRESDICAEKAGIAACKEIYFIICPRGMFD